MKRILIAVLVVALVAITIQSLTTSSFSIFDSAQTTRKSQVKKNVKIQILGDHNFKSTLENSKTIVVVDFYADWCGPCRGIAPAIQELANKYDGKVLVVKVNTDFAPQTAREEGVRSLPTVRVYAPGGKVLDTKTGGAYKDPRTGQWVPFDVKVYEKFIEPHLSKPEKPKK